jgi:predicted nucleic acid-binding protein
MAYATEAGKVLAASLLSNKVKAWTTKLALSETFYIICRSKGVDYAEEKIRSLMNSGMLNIYDSESLHLDAGKIKCNHAISIADCYIIASALNLNGRAVFSRREKEMVIEARKRSFDPPVVFLEEVLK